MTVNHQYTANSVVYSGATELTHKPTWASGITDGSTHDPITVVRRGSLVSISGLQFISPNKTTGVLTNLPAEYRPSKVVVLTGATQDDDRVIFNLASNGDLYWTNPVVLDTYFYVNGTYHIL